MVDEQSIFDIMRQLQSRGLDYRRQLIRKVDQSTSVEKLTFHNEGKICELIFINNQLSVIDYDGRSFDGKYTDHALSQIFQGILDQA